MKQLFNTLIISILTLLLASCSKEDTIEDFPSAITELVEMNTNSEKAVVSIRTDRGETFSVTNTSMKTATADTTYRCLCIYEKVNNTSVRIYQTSAIFSMLPLTPEKFTSHPKAPVKIISQWLTDRYINLYLSYMTVGADKHAFGFCEEKVEAESDGKQTVYVSLLHKHPVSDTDAYTQKLYMSVPTYEYAKTYDNIVFTVNTYDGPVEFKYTLR